MKYAIHSHVLPQRQRLSTKTTTDGRTRRLLLDDVWPPGFPLGTVSHSWPQRQLDVAPVPKTNSSSRSPSSITLTLTTHVSLCEDAAASIALPWRERDDVQKESALFVEPPHPTMEFFSGHFNLFSSADSPTPTALLDRRCKATLQCDSRWRHYHAGI